MVVMEELTDILIFKTNIKTLEDKILIQSILTGYPSVVESSVDCEDIDCVLRIVSTDLKPLEIINLIHKHGFHCQELE